MSPSESHSLTANYDVPFSIPSEFGDRPVTVRGIHWGSQWFHGDWIRGWKDWNWEQWIPWAQSMHLSWAVLLNDGDSALKPHQAAGDRSATQILLDAGILPLVRFSSKLPLGFPHLDHVEALISQVSKYHVPTYVLLGNEPGDAREWLNQDVPRDWMEQAFAWWIGAARGCIERGALVGFPDGPDYPLDVFQFIKDLPFKGDYLASSDVDDFFRWWEDGKVFYAGHHYGLNRPPDYPHDPVSREGTPLTEEEHKELLGPFYEAPGWRAPLDLINRQRSEQAWATASKPQPELTACWRSWELVQSWMVKHFGRVMPMAMTEGGWTPGAIAGTGPETIDDRWPKPTPDLVARYTMYAMEEVDHKMFAFCPWVAADQLMNGQGIWEGDAWRTGTYMHMGYDIDMPIVKALREGNPPVGGRKKMNKLGFYLHVANTPGLPEAIDKVKPPTILIHAGNRGLLHDIRRRLSPDTFIVGRWFVDLQQQDAWLKSDDPRARGRNLAEQILTFDQPFALERIDGRLLIDAWMSLNECLPGPASDQYKNGTSQERAAIETRARAYDLFQVGFRERLKEADEELEAVAFNFGAGNFQTADHYLDWFPQTLTSYTYLGFHEYGWPYLSERARPDGDNREVKSSAGTYRPIMDGIRQVHGERHRVIITEAGLARMYKHPTDGAGDVGWLYSEDAISQKEYRRSLRWYNRHLAKDDYVLGACLFEVGHGAKWETFRHLGVDNAGQPIQIVDWIAKLKEPTPPGPEPEPEPEPEPQPEPEPGSGSSGQAQVDARIAPLIGIEADEGNAYRLEEVTWMDPVESAGLHHIFIDVVNDQDERIVGETIRISWPGGSADAVTEEKPGEPWGANFAMFATLGSYAVQVAPEAGTSDRVTGLGMGTPAEPGVKHHTSFGLRFRKV